MTRTCVKTLLLRLRRSFAIALRVKCRFGWTLPTPGFNHAMDRCRDALGWRARARHRRAPRRHTHTLLGLQPAHAGDRPVDGTALRRIAHGRRRRATDERRGHRCDRAAGRADPRRRGLIRHESLCLAASLHATRRRARHLHAGIRCSASRGRLVPAHHAPVHQRLSFPHPNPRRADPRCARAIRRMVRDALSRGAMHQEPRVGPLLLVVET